MNDEEHAKPRGFTTRAVHAWRGVDVEQESASQPIYQSATFVFDDPDEFASVGESRISGGYLYSRWANPTVDALAQTVAALEGAPAAACFSSGMGAIHASLSSIVQPGGRIVAARQLYGGTFSLLTKALPAAGLRVSLVDITDADAVRAELAPGAAVLYCETIGNPSLPVADIDLLSALAHDAGAAFVVDATFTPPCLLTPLSHGADLVIHSATKYLGGHHDVTAGVVAGSESLVRAIRLCAIDLGVVLAPMEAWLTLRGIQTLGLRMERICANAHSLARFLEGRAGVSRVIYPGLPSHPQHAVARRLLPNGFGGMVAFDLEGGIEAGRRVMRRVRVASAAASLGGVKTLIVHPRSVTHSQLSDAQRADAGITDGMVRMSAGIEDIEDLIADLDQAIG